jgi:type I restriction enzyme S subunit
MSYPKYPENKDSGEPWLNMVPEHWSVLPLKYAVTFRSGGTPDKSRLDYWDGDIPWASAKDLKVEELFDTQDHISTVAMDDGAAELIQPGSVIVVVRGMILARIFPVSVVGVAMAINQDLKAVTVKSTLRPEYLAWLLRASEPETLSRLDEAGHGTKALRMDAWAAMRIPIPMLNEQERIHQFLGKETKRIDTLIEEQQRLIELLKEKRQAVISQAVTKGLDSSVPMKDSGVEWLGMVPAHWDMTSVKYCCMTVSGGTPNTAMQETYYTDETGIPWVRTMDLSNGILTSVEVYITEQALQDTACKILPPGTVMVAMYGGDGTVGKNGILGIHAAINQAVCGLSPSPKVLPEFLLRYMQFFRPFWMVGAESSRKDPNISQERVRNAPVPLPPKAEQKAISDFILSASDRFDALSAEAESAVALLQERRSALISAAVTGKIDVRCLQPEVV